MIFEPDGPITRNVFIETVRERAGLDSEKAARNATSATLSSLGERLSAGEAAVLALYLPALFGEDLVHVDDESANGYSFEEFVPRVSQREDIEKAEAKDYAQAVRSILADTASEREIEATRKQLPESFGVVFESPAAENK